MGPDLPLEAIAVAAALLWLAIAVLFARAVRGTGASRLRRILVPSAFFFFGMALVILGPLLLSSDLTFSPNMKTLWFALILLAVIGIGDAVAVELGAERTPPWLTGGIVGAALLSYGGLLAALGARAFQVSPFLAVPGLVAAAAAITWWPYLPMPEGVGPDDEEAAEVFE